MAEEYLNLTQLGRNSPNPTRYDPNLLETIPRNLQRERMGLRSTDWRHFGADVWVAHELSWLDIDTKPQNALVRLTIPCASPNIVESKSFKLYIQSFSHARFSSKKHVNETMKSDLGAACESTVGVELLDVQKVLDYTEMDQESCLDRYTTAVLFHEPDRSLLKQLNVSTVQRRKVHTHLFRSVCPVTGQPDFATVLIEYRGAYIREEELLAYLLSYRNFASFHETVIEKIFCDLEAACELVELTVSGFFLRRGGVDITPVRSTRNDFIRSKRSQRQ